MIVERIKDAIAARITKAEAARGRHLPTMSDANEAHSRGFIEGLCAAEAMINLELIEEATRISQPVLDAHAQFGGDLEDMQRRYDAATPSDAGQADSKSGE